MMYIPNTSEAQTSQTETRISVQFYGAYSSYLFYNKNTSDTLQMRPLNCELGLFLPKHAQRFINAPLINSAGWPIVWLISQMPVHSQDREVTA